MGRWSVSGELNNPPAANIPLDDPLEAQNKWSVSGELFGERPQAAMSYQQPEMPWWYNALQTGVSWLEWMRIPGDLTRSIAYDLFVRKPGERSELWTFLKNLKYYAPGGTSPEIVAPGTSFFKAMGLEGRTADVAGFLIEVGLDPFVIADAAGTALVRGGQKAAVKTLEKAVGYKASANVTRDAVWEAARQLERMGDVDSAAMMKAAAQKMELGQRLRSPVEWVPEPTRVAVGNTVIKVLDKVPTPFVARMTPGGSTVERPLSLAEFIFTKPAQAELHADVPEMYNFWKEYFGEADVTKLAKGEESAIPSAFEQAKHVGELASARILMAARNTHKYWRDVTGLTADVAPKEYTLWSKAVADWIDNLQSGEKLTRELAAKGKMPSVDDLIDFSRFQPTIYERMKQIAPKVGASTDELFEAARNAVKENLNAAAEVGWKLANMDDYVSVVNKVAQSVEKPSDEVGLVLWKAAYGKELDEAEQAILKAFENEWKTSGGLLAQINPLEYIRGISDGYYRRVLGVYANEPELLRKMVTSIRGGTRWMPAREIGADDFIGELEKVAGKDAADKVAQFVVAYGDGTVTPEMLANYTGVDANAIMEAALRANVTDLSPKMRRILEEELASRGGRGHRPAFALTGRKLFQPRKLPDEAVDAWLPFAKLEERAASFAIASRRAIQGREVIKVTNDLLSKYGLVANSPDVLHEIGVKQVFKLPDNAALGPLAGKYIPRQVAETFLRTVETGDPGLFARFLNNVRVAWLAAPGTISRNVAGGITMMHAGGITPQEMASHAQEALEAYMAFRKAGDITKLGPGHELLKLFGEGEIAGEAGDQIARGLAELIQTAGVKPTSKWTDKLNKYGKYVKDTLTGRPLFDLFQMTEDYMRTLTFFIVRERLVKRGLSLKEAGLQAAQIANNILFDYSSQPEMTRVMKKMGLFLFPAFPVFNLGRTAKLAITRPAAIAIPDRITQASLDFVPEDERNAAARIVHDAWVGDEAPLFIPSGQPGTFYVMPIKQLFPQLAGADLLNQTVNDPLRGGIIAPVIEAATAFSREGEAVWSGKYGERVFDPLLQRTVPQRVGSALEFIGRQYAPGHIRYLGDAINNMSKYYRSSNPQLVTQVLGDNYGYGYAKAIAKAFGVNYQQYGGGHDVENIQRLQSQFMDDFAKARARLQQAAAAGDAQGMREAQKAMQGAVMQYQKSVCEYFGGHFDGQQCK